MEQSLSESLVLHYNIVQNRTIIGDDMAFWEKQRIIKNLYELYAKPIREKYDLTQMEYSILLFLYRNPDCDTASAIVRISQFTKSHVSTATKKLEERGLITGEHEGNNNKTVHLRLTDLAEKILQEAADATERYKKCLFNGFSGEELQQMRHYFGRICENAESKLQNLEEEKKDA